VIEPLVETGDTLAAALAARGLLRDEAIERIELAARRSGLPFSAVAVRLGLVGEWEMAQALSAFCCLPIASTGDYQTRMVEIGDLNAVFLREKAIVILAANDEHVEVSMVDPLDEQAAADAAVLRHAVNGALQRVRSFELDRRIHGFGPLPVSRAARELRHQRPVSRYCGHCRPPAAHGDA
jgi:hypothetical protein